MRRCSAQGARPTLDGAVRHRDQEIADAVAGAGEPLPFQPDLLAVAQPGRDLDVDLLAGRQLHALPHALGRFRQRDGQRCSMSRPPATIFVLLELDAAASARAAPPKASLRISSKPAKAAAGTSARPVDAVATPG